MPPIFKPWMQVSRILHTYMYKSTRLEYIRGMQIVKEWSNFEVVIRLSYDYFEAYTSNVFGVSLRAARTMTLEYTLVMYAQKTVEYLWAVILIRKFEVHLGVCVYIKDAKIRTRGQSINVSKGDIFFVSLDTNWY